MRAAKNAFIPVSYANFAENLKINELAYLQFLFPRWVSPRGPREERESCVIRRSHSYVIMNTKRQKIRIPCGIFDSASREILTHLESDRPFETI